MATVSRVINSSGNVSPELKARVEKALDELGYALNVAARSLRTNKTYTIGVLTSEINNPLIPDVAQGIEAVAAAAGYSMVICTTQSRFDLEDNYVSLLSQNRADGLIFDSVLEGSRVVERLKAKSYPFVLVARKLAEFETNFVGIDNHDGMLQAIKYLHNLGHRRIGYISGDATRSSVSRERLAGFEAGLKIHGIPFNPEYVISDTIVRGTYVSEGGYLAVPQLMGLPDPPTAIMANTDTVAFGAWRWLHKNGFHVPRDVSLVGFDNIEASSLGSIGLTTVRINRRELGVRAAQLLIQEIEGEKGGTPRQIILPVELVVRETCAPPRRGEADHTDWSRSQKQVVEQGEPLAGK